MTYEVQIKSVLHSQGRVRGANGTEYSATPTQCNEAAQLIQRGRTAMAEVDDKNEDGSMATPLRVVRVFDPHAPS